MSRRRLRVGLDGRAFASPAAGVRRYLHELTSALLDLELPLDLVACGGPPPARREILREPEPWHPPTNLGWTAVGVMRAARRARLDVYHAPAYTAPPYGVHPLVITLHDVSYARHPEWYPHRLGRLRSWFYRASARAADIIITDSTFSSREIAIAYGVPQERIRVIPLGVSGAFVPGPTGVLPSAVRPPYFLHVGDLHERRNLRVALEAVMRLRAAGSSAQLVLAGIDRGAVASLAAYADQHGDPDAIVPLGSVPEEVLLNLYRAAVGLAYPSRYEGFGLPMVEAMACGIPVLASKGSTAEEVVGDAAVLLSPDDPGAWGDAMQMLLADVERAADLRERSLRRARTFTWERTALATWQVYEAMGLQR